MQVINISKALIASRSYKATCHNNILYLSRQIPIDSITIQLYSQNISLQIKQVLDNRFAICNAAGLSFNDIVKLISYLIDIQRVLLSNDMMTDYSSRPFLLLSMISVTAQLLGVKIEAIMMIGKFK
jgi:enamine deaminase RidA (YjgF/YER057c/UK114 family)